MNVTSNKRIFDDQGVQIAEFDVEIRGIVGTTDFAWLIECRDRPGNGSAPASWIEQLVGRRSRSGFNKVTAVSTTGFSRGAKDFAHQQGIELREVRSLDPTEFANWLHFSTLTEVRHIHDLKHAEIFIHPDESTEAQRAAEKVIQQADGIAGILIPYSTSENVRLTDAFLGAVQQATDLWRNVVVGILFEIQLSVQYVGENLFRLATEIGMVRIHKINFYGELRKEETEVTIDSSTEYRHIDAGRVISQFVSSNPPPLLLGRPPNSAMLFQGSVKIGSLRLTIHRETKGSTKCNGLSSYS